MQPQKIDADGAGLKLVRRVTGRLLVLAIFSAPLAAQGPGPVGLRQPPPIVAAQHRVATSAALPDTTHVPPNHWKRGARIGFIAVAVPAAAWLIGADCEPLLKPGLRCALGKTVFAVSAGVAGALVGGFVGSFFPKGEPRKAGT